MQPDATKARGKHRIWQPAGNLNRGLSGVVIAWICAAWTGAGGRVIWLARGFRPQTPPAPPSAQTRRAVVPTVDHLVDRPRKLQSQFARHAGSLEILRQLKSFPTQPRVLVFSSQDKPAVVREVIEAGATGMVEKVAPMDTLLKAIKATAAGQAFFGDAIAAALQKSLLGGSCADGLASLSAREREVLQQVASGQSNKEIAIRLGISLKTAENHRHNLMVKLAAHNAADLTRIALRFGVVLPEEPPKQTTG